MKLISVSPEVTQADVDLMMKRVGIKEEDITKVMGESDWVLSIRQRLNYTVAMITTKTFPTAIGVAKRMPIDPMRPITGARLAIRRCLEEVKELM